MGQRRVCVWPYSLEYAWLLLGHSHHLPAIQGKDSGSVNHELSSLFLTLCSPNWMNISSSHSKGQRQLAGWSTLTSLKGVFLVRAHKSRDDHSRCCRRQGTVMSTAQGIAGEHVFNTEKHVKRREEKRKELSASLRARNSSRNTYNTHSSHVPPYSQPQHVPTNSVHDTSLWPQTN